MTILPNCSKKKSQQGSSSGEIDNGDSNTNSGHHTSHQHQHQLPNLTSLPSHIAPNGEGTSRSPLYISSQSPPPCWSPTNNTNIQREEKRASHSSPSHYEDGHDNSSAHTKRRYRASPLRSVRPKLREHRGNTSPPYPSNKNELWNVTSVSHQHSLGHPHNHHLAIASSSLAALPSSRSPQAGTSRTHNGPESDEDPTAYNSGDEYETFGGWNLTKEQWEEKERWFEKKMKKKSRIIKKMREDGACLFRAIADQVYGDQDMHPVVRKQCMDYIERNGENFAPFVSETFETYIERKRRHDCFGNHIEIAALSEMYNRVIEVYCYSNAFPTKRRISPPLSRVASQSNKYPINIFQGSLKTDNAPIRLSYHRGTHYNSLVDPYHATIGVGLGLPGFQPGLADKNLMTEATRLSENFHLEKTMLEDKIRATDFEATSEAIEEQVAQQSYLDWLRQNNMNENSQGPSSESASKSPKDRRSSQHSEESSTTEGNSRASPRQSPRPSDSLRTSPRRCGSPRTGNSCSNESLETKNNIPNSDASSSTVDLAVPGSSKDPMPSSSRCAEYNGFQLNERASFLNHLPPSMFGLGDYASEEADILAQVLAASQQEYLDSLKTRKEESPESPLPPNSPDRTSS